MMFQGDFGGILDLGWRAAHDRAKPGRSHGRRRPNLALAANLGSGNRGVMLDDAANRRRRQQEGAPLLRRRRILPVLAEQLEVEVERVERILHLVRDAGGDVPEADIRQKLTELRATAHEQITAE